MCGRDFVKTNLETMIASFAFAGRGDVDAMANASSPDEWRARRHFLPEIAPRLSLLDGSQPPHPIYLYLILSRSALAFAEIRRLFARAAYMARTASRVATVPSTALDRF